MPGFRGYRDLNIPHCEVSVQYIALLYIFVYIEFETELKLYYALVHILVYSVVH